MGWRRRLQCAAVCLACRRLCGSFSLLQLGRRRGQPRGGPGVGTVGRRRVGACLALDAALDGGARDGRTRCGFVLAPGPLLTRNFMFISLVEESGIYCLLGVTFARSLTPSQVALCTQLADQGPRAAVGARGEVYPASDRRVDLVLFRHRRRLGAAVRGRPLARLVVLHQFLRPALDRRHVRRRVSGSAPGTARRTQSRPTGHRAGLFRESPLA